MIEREALSEIRLLVNAGENSLLSVTEAPSAAAALALAYADTSGLMALGCGPHPCCWRLTQP